MTTARQCFQASKVHCLVACCCPHSKAVQMQLILTVPSIIFTPLSASAFTELIGINRKFNVSRSDRSLSILNVIQLMTGSVYLCLFLHVCLMDFIDL